MQDPDDLPWNFPLEKKNDKHGDPDETSRGNDCTAEFFYRFASVMNAQIVFGPLFCV
jgi:hypothetical protein